MLEIKGKYNTAKVFTDNCDDATIAQITNLLNQETVKGTQIRIMPDCHAGAGCVIGTTMTIRDRVIPNLVGVDIGCGMLAFKLKEKRIDLPKFDSIIHTKIPSGFNIRTTPHSYSNKVSTENLHCFGKPNCKVTAENMLLSVGTLGGGNHFIELDKDEEDNIWLVIHTGSRHSGKCVAEYYQTKAYEDNNKLGDALKQQRKEKIKKIVEQLKAEGRQKEISEAIQNVTSDTVPIKIPYEVAYCIGDLFYEYLHDMNMMQIYAITNRQAIANVIFENTKLHPIEEFETIHNYIDMEHMILRKGSVSARRGEKLLIPINMRDGSLICVGKGNEDWNYSAPHGAGRIMSRNQAINSISMKDYKDSMTGIYSTCINKATVDESAFAYKPMEEIIKNIEPTVEIISRLKPIYNFKAGNDE